MSDNASIRTLPESLQERMARAPALKPGIYYNLINLQSGTAMDLSGSDWRSVIGWPSHTDLNQQWEFAPLGAGYSVRCVFTSDSYFYCDNHDGSNYNDFDENDTNSITSNGSRQTLPVSSESKKKHLKYLAPNADGLRHDAPLVTSAFPIAWQVERAGVDFPVPFSLDPQSPGGKVVGAGLGDGDVVRIRWPRGYIVDLGGWGNSKPGQRVQLAKEQAPVHKCQLWRLVECSGRPARVKIPKVVSNDVTVGNGVTPIPSKSQLGYTICSMCRRITSNAEVDAEATFTTTPPGYEVSGAERGQLTSRELEPEQKQEQEHEEGIANGSDNDHAPATRSKSAQPEWDLLSDSDLSSVMTSENDTEAFYSERERELYCRPWAAN